MNTLHTFIVVLACAYMEYTTAPWLDKSVYRRTVNYSAIPWC